MAAPDETIPPHVQLLRLVSSSRVWRAIGSPPGRTSPLKRLAQALLVVAGLVLAAEVRGEEPEPTAAAPKADRASGEPKAAPEGDAAEGKEDGPSEEDLAERSRKKARFHLFDRTPSDLLRPLSTDRPDQTEGPFTVDAGHVQLESDFLTYTYDRVNVDHAKVRVQTFTPGTINLRLGLADFVDCHFIFAPWTYQHTRDLEAHETSHRQGWGDLTFRVKVNLWGNEGGRTALALLPYVTFPTARKGLGPDAYEGGLILPLNVILGGGFSVGTHLQLGAERDEGSNGTHLLFSVPVSLSYEIREGLQAYLEFFDRQTTEAGVPWTGSIDFGITWVVAENVQIDAGCNVGITRSADDVNPFFGITIRF